MRTKIDNTTLEIERLTGERRRLKKHRKQPYEQLDEYSEVDETVEEIEKQIDETALKIEPLRRKGQKLKKHRRELYKHLERFQERDTHVVDDGLGAATRNYYEALLLERLVGWRLGLAAIVSLAVLDWLLWPRKS